MTNGYFGFRRGLSGPTAHPDRIGSPTVGPNPIPRLETMEPYQITKIITTGFFDNHASPWIPSWDWTRCTLRPWPPRSRCFRVLSCLPRPGLCGWPCGRVFLGEKTTNRRIVLDVFVLHLHLLYTFNLHITTSTYLLFSAKRIYSSIIN